MARIQGDPPYYAGPRAPVIDDQWLQYHPEQSYYYGQQLVHHHYLEGPTAIPLPEAFHSRQPWWGYWHPGRGGPDYIDPTTGDLGKYYRDLFGRAQRHGPFGGIFDGPPPLRPVQPGRTN